ncbi:DUF488 domain-containing protein [Ralstonia solanacearum]|uniref:DUF488 family protein n=2 Tax=Ralstonia solanacearum TaxID=305 RepID=A0AAW5ZGU3_RALSL|nr:DUF488 family protein [Ralstonia solanacearum]AST35336.2 DUF488 family protein [Ralstonia solanacearum]ATJ88224.1 hypothetical protein CDC59_18240 [Ralstonia solanacearum]MDB0507791.1 DUF488 family protein [Ralstonia solanacearum]MDB0512061.1 DUF488 family protein [Ralstonia solanacearum]MDB0566451.1 DUF488 family protein [Ralstonia solanacearum]
MTLRIVRLGEPRHPDEGLRIGTVRRPPRGVPKTEFARRDFYDVWMPLLSPSPDLVKEAQAAQTAHDEKGWLAFVRRFRAEMSEGDATRLLDMLAALSHQTNLSVGCYCEDEAHCHRSVLRALLVERGAKVAG